MRTKILEKIITLFVIFSKNIQDESGFAIRSFIEVYLSRNFSQESVDLYLSMFDNEFDKNITQHKNRIENVQTGLDEICNEINEQLVASQKIKVVIQIIDVLNYIINNYSKSSTAVILIKHTLDKLNISESLTNDLINFAQGHIQYISNKSNLVIASNLDSSSFRNFKTHFVKNLNGKIYFYLIPDTNTFTLYLETNDELELSGTQMIQKRIYCFEKHDSIKGKQILPIYFYSILTHFLGVSHTDITLCVDNVSYSFPNSESGIKEVSLTAKSGELVAIMGGSGSGKTTCLNLLCGNLKPKTGKITINGIDVQTRKKNLKGIIGFVPQDDFLFEELTVKENLFFNASLCNSNLSKFEIDELVDRTLKAIDIFEIRDLVVGTPLNNIISGGQRKRLNIALELLREPYILFLDEPTSGLSSADSEHIIDLLKEIAMRGKIVVLNIHQPSSDIFKLFDKLLILDKFGYPVYFGNQIKAIEYLKTKLYLVDANKSECSNCGFINPEQIFKLIEARKLDRKGNELHYRLISPFNWHKLYKKNHVASDLVDQFPTELPKNNLNIPNPFKQFLIFSHRNLKSKFSDKQYILLSLIEAPILGSILGFFTKFTDSTSTKYSFSENENIPAFFFMSVLVALFLGMIVSAEEIIKDKKVIKRESFLNLSKTSFINSKILFLFTLSAVQIGTFLAIACNILEINDIFWSYFLILWVTACSSNILGLLLSSVLQSKSAIYVTIPFILIPQILLAGTIVRFDKLNSAITSPEYVPVIGELMVSRWAYEAIAVTQFISNPYYKEIYPFDKVKSDATYIANYLIPNIESKLDEYYSTNDITKKQELKSTILWGFSELQEYNTKSNTLNQTLTDLENKTNDKYIFLKINKDQAINKIDSFSLAKDKYLAQFNQNDIIFLKNRYWNNKLASTLMGNEKIKKVILHNGLLIRRFQPIYYNPTNKYGRSHFYAPNKFIGNTIISTFTFNVLIIILHTLSLYILLLAVNNLTNKYRLPIFSKQ